MGEGAAIAVAFVVSNAQKALEFDALIDIDVFLHIAFGDDVDGKGILFITGEELIAASRGAGDS